MKRCILFSLLLFPPLIAQPREGISEQEQTQPNKELATYLTHLNQTGQLPEKPQEKPKEDLTEEEKFQEAANKIFASMLTLISGARSGDPLQIAAGVFGMFSSAFMVATRNKLQDEELMPTRRKRSISHMDQAGIAQIKSALRKNPAPFTKRAR
jgi:hypothetical protein